jgi:hypothetical protein
MKTRQLCLSSVETLLLERSQDLALTRRRTRLVVLSAVFLVVAIVVAAPLLQSWQFLLFFAVAYISLTTWERLGYARTILAYKGLIQKLAARIGELEAGVEDGGRAAP